MEEYPLKGLVFAVQRYSLDDGSGIRTCVFLKGCPLRCAWCHNAESQRQNREISYCDSACIHCSACTVVCTAKCHHFDSAGRHVFERDRCVLCGDCAKVCPTNALADDRTLDARKCLNYWTIENRDEIPQEIAQKLDGRLFGCDLCQRVCPHNAAIETAEERELPLDAVERLDETTFRRLFKKTPIFRARVEGLKRVAENLRREKKDRDRNETGADDDQ